MRLRLLQWLACPICRGELGLATRANHGASASSNEDIDYGALTCSACHVYYPVWNGVPRMLTYASQASDLHAQHAPQWIADALEGFRLPDREPAVGEHRVLKNFSTEWLGYEWTGESYWNVTAEHMLVCKRYELGAAPGSLKHKLLLEVGIGIGGTADALARVEDCEVVGMDLGYAVDQARRYFGQNP